MLNSVISSGISGAKKGGGKPNFAPPPHLTINYNMIMIVDHLLSKFVSSQKVPTFLLDA